MKELSKETRKALAELLATESEAQEGENFQIAVLDKGFVYVGYCSTDGDTIRIRKPHNIRKWGTKNGLGELSLNGPLAGTILDPCRDITAPYHALIHLMDCEESQWA